MYVIQPDRTAWIHEGSCVCSQNSDGNYINDSLTLKKKQKALLCAELVQYGTDVIPAQFLSMYDSQNDQQL